MRFRAIAMASERSNAVGTVELECEPVGLSLVYLGVGAFVSGYVPTNQAMNEVLTVRWSELIEASVDGEQVFLALDPKLGPLNRLCLVNFSTGQGGHHHKLYRRRLLVRLATVGAALSGALVASAAAFRLAPGTSAVSALGIALITALALCALGFFADQLLKGGGLEGPLARAEFVAELSGFVPSLVRSPYAPPRSTTPKTPPVARLQGFLPRTTAAIVMSLSALMLSFVLMVRWLLTSDPAHELAAHVPRRSMPAEFSPPLREHLPVNAAVAVPSARLPSPSAAPSAAASPAAQATVSCRCQRSDSLLWQAPIPKLSVLRLSQRVHRGRDEDERKDKLYLEVDVGVVNNSADPLTDVALQVEFFERDPPPSTKRYSVATRPLFFEGPLLPGQSIKWNVEARGTEFEIHSALGGDIGVDGDTAAPSNLLADLLHAHNRAVRMHGAMLLTFMSDPRAKDAILELREALREDEAPYLDRLLQAVSSVRVCALKVSEFGDSRRVSACVFNASKEARVDLGLRIRALDGMLIAENPTAASPSVLAENTLAVPVALLPDAGVRVQGDFELAGTKPASFEAFADRIDLLPK